MTNHETVKIAFENMEKQRTESEKIVRLLSKYLQSYYDKCEADGNPDNFRKMFNKISAFTEKLGLGKLQNTYPLMANDYLLFAEDIYVCCGEKFIPCRNFFDASETVKKYVSDKNISYKEFYAINNTGIIFHRRKGAYAHVTWQGRVWLGVDKWHFDYESIEITGEDLDGTKYTPLRIIDRH